MKAKVRIKFEPRDLWVGIFWERIGRTTTLETDREQIRVYLCLLPCLPIIFTISSGVPRFRRHKHW